MHLSSEHNSFFSLIFKVVLIISRLLGKLRGSVAQTIILGNTKRGKLNIFSSPSCCCEATPQATITQYLSPIHLHSTRAKGKMKPLLLAGKAISCLRFMQNSTLMNLNLICEVAAQPNQPSLRTNNNNGLQTSKLISMCSSSTAHISPLAGNGLLHAFIYV